MLLNQLMFQANGGINCGYVTKPDFLLIKDKKEREDNIKNNYQEVNKTLSIEVVSAQILESHTEEENEQAFPLVEVTVYGQQSDMQMNRGMTTKIYPNNQFRPVFVDSDVETFAVNVFEDSGVIEKKEGSIGRRDSEDSWTQLEGQHIYHKLSIINSGIVSKCVRLYISNSRNISLRKSPNSKIS